MGDLSDSEHIEMSNNPKAELFLIKNVFQEYIKLGYPEAEAMQMTGITKKDVIEMKLNKIEFNNKMIENLFREAEEKLFLKYNLFEIKYKDFNISTFSKQNKQILHKLANKSIVYCLWIGDTFETLEPMYIGQAKNTNSKNRIKAHLQSKNKTTGAQLEKIKGQLTDRKIIGLSFVIVEPDYMRTSIEGWLMNKRKFKWNKNN